MDLSNTWKKLEKEKLEAPIQGELNKDQSNHPVSKLKKNYFIKSMMMIFFVMIFGLIAIIIPITFVRIIFGGFAIAYTIFTITSYMMYKTINLDGPVLEVLIKTKDQVTRALKFEMISSLMIIPFGGIAGYVGSYSMSGKSMDKIFSNPMQLGIMAGVIVISVILGYYLGKKLTREGYGKSLDEIGMLIKEMKSE